MDITELKSDVNSLDSRVTSISRVEDYVTYEDILRGEIVTFDSGPFDIETTNLKAFAETQNSEQLSVKDNFVYDNTAPCMGRIDIMNNSSSEIDIQVRTQDMRLSGKSTLTVFFIVYLNHSTERIFRYDLYTDQSQAFSNNDDYELMKLHFGQSIICFYLMLMEICQKYQILIRIKQISRNIMLEFILQKYNVVSYQF